MWLTRARAGSAVRRCLATRAPPLTFFQRHVLVTPACRIPRFWSSRQFSTEVAATDANTAVENESEGVTETKSKKKKKKRKKSATASSTAEASSKTEDHVQEKIPVVEAAVESVPKKNKKKKNKKKKGSSAAAASEENVSETVAEQVEEVVVTKSKKKVLTATVVESPLEPDVTSATYIANGLLESSKLAVKENGHDHVVHALRTVLEGDDIVAKNRTQVLLQLLTQSWPVGGAAGWSQDVQKFSKSLNKRKFSKVQPAVLTAVRAVTGVEMLPDSTQERSLEQKQAASLLRQYDLHGPGKLGIAFRYTKPLTKHVVSSPSNSTNPVQETESVSSSNWSAADKEKKRKEALKFESHLDKDDVAKGLEDGSLLKGIFRVAAFQTGQAFILHKPKGATKPIKIPITGYLGRNRAMNGDVVVVKPLWQAYTHGSNTPSTTSETGVETESNENVEQKEGEVVEDRDLSKARCRVVSIESRDVGFGPIACVLRSAKGSQDLSDLPLVNGLVRVQPRDSRLPPFFLPQDDVKSMLATAGEQKVLSQEDSYGRVVVVRYSDWPAERLEGPLGTLDAILGTEGDAKTESDVILMRYKLNPRPHTEGLELELRDSVKPAYDAPTREICDYALAHDSKRQDFRQKLRIFTIDPPTAKDLDDAISVERLPGDRYRIGVHVADVSYFLREGSNLDKDAAGRATTTYVVSHCYPMLPRLLSEQLCSLLPNEDRLAFSVFYTLKNDGSLDEEDVPTFTQSAIHCTARLDYDQVDSLLGDHVIPGTRPCPQATPEILSDLEVLMDLTHRRRLMRLSKGAISLSRNTEMKFDLDSHSLPTNIRTEHAEAEGGISQTGNSHELIEELMVLANHVVAKHLVDSKSVEPIVRQHRQTESEVRQAIFDALRPIISAEELEHKVGKLSVVGLLNYCRDSFDPMINESISFLAMQKFKQAEYVVADQDDQSLATKKKRAQVSDDDIVDTSSYFHWALNLPTYLHFTSPIRRYADVVVHRHLADLLHDRTPTQKGSALEEICKNCNVQKRAAFDAGVECQLWFFSQFLRRQKNGEYPLDSVILEVLTSSRKEETHGTVASEAEEESEQSEVPVAVKFFVPLLGQEKSISFKSLGVEWMSGPDPTGKVVVKHGEFPLHLKPLTKCDMMAYCAPETSPATPAWTLRLPSPKPSTPSPNVFTNSTTSSSTTVSTNTSSAMPSVSQIIKSAVPPPPPPPSFPKGPLTSLLEFQQSRPTY